jgi:hypothetical protein
MTQENILRMAREASRYASHQTGDSLEWQRIRDERFAILVAAAEREACAKECDAVSASADNAALAGQYLIIKNGAEARRCAAAIRARSKT